EHQPPAATAENLAASGEFQARLENALAELPEKLRLVLLLAAMEGHTIDETAGILGISTGTVKSRIFYARKQLAEKLRCYANTIKKRSSTPQQAVPSRTGICASTLMVAQPAALN